MTQIREPAVAGYFYPDKPGELSANINAMLCKVRARPGPAPKALIVPHAGYRYSGPVAAAAYQQLKPHARRYSRVVLLGPCHQSAVAGLAVSDAVAFRTPLGTVALDHEVITSLHHREVIHAEAPHHFEHSLEVQLPFLQMVLGTFSLVPLAVGATDSDTVAEVIDLLWGGQETLIVISSDLSHYLRYEEANRRDRATCESIEAMDADHIDYRDACGANLVAGLLIAARRREVRVRTLDLRNSGDTAGDTERVVGYGAWMLQEHEV